MATYTTLSALFTAIADAIRAKTGSAEEIVADNFPTAIAALNPLQTATALVYAFDGASLPASIIIDAPNVSDLRYSFRNAVGASKIVLHVGAVKTASYAFYCVTPETTLTSLDIGSWMGSTSVPTMENYQNFLTNRAGLKTIIGTISLARASSVQSMFGGCAALETLTFARNSVNVNTGLSFSDSPLLSTASLISIANALVYDDFGASVLTLHATSQTACGSIYVVNDGGTAVLSSSGTAGAMSLTTFVTTVKGWTIA